MRRIPLVALIAVALLVVAGAQAPPTPVTVVVRAARMLDVTSGTLVPNAVVIIEGERIKAAGSGLAVPSGATVIDLGSATLLPGLIDSHTHLMMRIKDDEEYGVHLLMKSQADRALEGAANARETLQAGFTTVRDVENEGSVFADVSLRNAINDGLVPGPRMQVATRAIAAVGQYHPFGISADLDHFPMGAQMVSGVEEARRAVREQIGHGADLIKVYADWEHPTLTLDEMKVIVTEAHGQGRKVAVHAIFDESIRRAVEAGADSIEHCEMPTKETLQLMKEKGTVMVSTAGVIVDLVNVAKTDDERSYFKKRIESLKRVLAMAREVGVTIVNGMDASEARLQGKNAMQITTVVDWGMPAIDAIRASTVNAAALMGWSHSVGSLESGKFADIIAIAGDPLANINELTKVTFVMKGGVVVRR